MITATILGALIVRLCGSGRRYLRYTLFFIGFIGMMFMILVAKAIDVEQEPKQVDTFVIYPE